MRSNERPWPWLSSTCIRTTTGQSFSYSSRRWEPTATPVCEQSGPGHCQQCALFSEEAQRNIPDELLKTSLRAAWPKKSSGLDALSVFHSEKDQNLNSKRNLPASVADGGRFSLRFGPCASARHVCQPRLRGSTAQSKVKT